MEMKDLPTDVSRHQLFVGVLIGGGDGRLLLSTTLAGFLLLCRIRPSRASSSLSASLSAFSSSSSDASSSPSSSSHNSFCSVYSYNWRLANVAKDFFVCCANPSDEPCHGITYQKPSRTEAFCRGQIIDDQSHHWTQIETDFGNHGSFYCGGCCGQHLASNGCNEEWRKSSGVCFNWALCFMKQCQKIDDNIALGRHLKCSVPPPPYPKHYMEETRTLPANYSYFYPMGTAAPSPGRAANASSTFYSSGCSVAQCKSLTMEKRCQMSCCINFCCLQDGSSFPDVGGGRALVGLSAVQMMAVVFGMIAFVVIVVALSVCLAKRCTSLDMSLSSSHVPHDSRILVIEEQEEQNESDVESV